MVRIISGYIMRNNLILFLILPGNGVDISRNNNVLGCFSKEKYCFEVFSNIHHSFV